MKLHIFFLMLTALTAAAFAEPNIAPDDPNQLTILNDYLRYAEQHNAELRAAYEQWRSALETIPQAKALPDPKATFDVETRRSPTGQTYGISQTFPWFGTIEARTAAASATAQAAEKRYLAQKLALFSDVKQAYYDYSLLARQVEIARQNLELLRHFEEITRAQYATAKTSHPDHIRSQIEIANAQYEEQRLAGLQPPLTARLNSLLNRRQSLPLPWPAQATFQGAELDESRIVETLLKNNPDLQATEFDIMAARQQAELAHKKFYPEIDLGLGLFANSEATMGPGRDPLFARVSITIPLWTNSYSAAERQAAADLQQAVSRKIQLQNNLVAQAMQKLYGVQDTARRVLLYKDALIPQSKDMLAAYEASYRSGGSDFLSLIDAQRKLLEFQLEYEKAVIENAQRTAELEKLVGGELFRKSPPDANSNQ